MARFRANIKNFGWLSRAGSTKSIFNFTGHEFKSYLKESNAAIRKRLYVNNAGRIYQFWERDSLSKEWFIEKFLMQKLNYIHTNPCKPHWNLATIPEDYKWSSGSFYYMA